MPSYRYTREISPDDLQPTASPELSGKDKRKNWWHYHWKILVIILIIAALLASFVYELVSQDTPDLSIGVLSPTDLPTSVVELLQEQLGALVGDVNGDGKTVVQVTVFTVALGDEEAQEEDSTGADTSLTTSSEAYTYTDPYAQMAGVTKFVGALQDSETMVFLVATDMLPVYQTAYSFLANLDGTLADEDSSTQNDISFLWEESPVLSNLDLTIHYEDGSSYDGQINMLPFSVALRYMAPSTLEGDETASENYALALELINSWR